VVEKNVVAGQNVMAGQMLYRVADLGEVWLEGEVFEQDLATVRVGAEATAELQSLPGVRRRGRVAYVSPTLDPETRTAKVRVALANADLALKPGMVATIHFNTPGAAGIASVPRSAVLSTGERSMVFVRLPGGRLEPHEVTLGAANDLRVQILRGLALGDTVVASATFLVDAESNLGTALGGMGDMPGMDMAKPVPLSGDTARRR
jgi:Cu(I)/Ag(I) efflux system membrane fusion protein